MKRALADVLMVLCLLIAQQAGYAHALWHFDHRSPASQDKQLPHTKVCGQCALSAQLGTGLLGHSTTRIATAAATSAVFGPSHIVYLATPRRFMSRAPPAFL
jgi:hypothetical protein